jgi:hypothetical protein
MEKGQEFEDPPPGGGFKTVTLSVPAVTISSDVICAVSCEEFTNVVGCELLFH